MKDNNKKFFEGWKVLIGCFFIVAIYGIVYNVTSVYIIPISESLSVSRTQTSTYITLINFSMMIGTLFVGNIIKKLGIKKVMLIGATMIASGTFIFSIANNISVIYLGALSVGFGCGISTTVPVLIIINNWFIKNRGVIIAIVMSATTLAGGIFNPISNYIIENFSWRTSYIVTGIIIVFMAIPAILFLIIEHPSQKGMQAYGQEISKNIETKSVINENGITLKQALSTSYFWILSLSLVLIGIQAGVMASQLVPFLTDGGLTPAFAASAISVVLFSGAISKPLAGILFDKIGVKKGCIIGLIFSLVGFLLLNISLQPTIVLLGSACLGVGGFINTIGPSLLTSECFGRKYYDSIIGIINVCLLLGVAIGPIASSFMYDMLGSYNLVLKICTVIIIVSLILIPIAISQANKKLKIQNEVYEDETIA